MGTENSKVKKSENENRGDVLRFGPQNNRLVPQPSQSQYALNHNQLTQPSTHLQRSSQNIVPPPAYTVCDPLQRPVESLANINATGQKYKTTNINSEQNHFNNVQIGNNAQKISHNEIQNKNQNNPFVWQNADQPSFVQSEFIQQQSPVKKSSIPDSAQASSKNNPFIDSNKNEIDHKILDFERKLTSLKQDVSSFKNNGGSSVITELKRNKPLSEVRKCLINNEFLSDIRLTYNSKVYHGHKLFLITASPLFYQHFHVDGHNEMTIDGISEDIFQTILTFCYSGNLPKITEDNVLSILLASDKYKISQAYSTCCSFISSQINANGVFIILEKAIQLNNEQFQKKCMDYIKKNESKCFNSNGFFKINLSSLIVILEKCGYQNDKSNEIIEKWNHGPIIAEMKNSTVTDKVNVKQADISNDQKKKKNPKQPKAPNKNMEGPKNKTAQQQAPKKSQKAQKTASHTNIQNLMDLQIPPPPFTEGFHGQASGIRSFNSMGSFSNDLICLPIDDGTKYKSYDELSDLVCVDDDDGKNRTRVEVKGTECNNYTEFSRIDFLAKRSFLLHEFCFNENIIANCTEIKLSISVFEGDKRSDIHTRCIRKKSDNKLNYIKFSRQPLKIYLGQKFFIKLNFNVIAQRKHLDPQNLSLNDFIELRKSDEVRKYFNCINKLVVSEMT